MARHWAPVVPPNTPEIRSRSVIQPLQGIGSAVWGQRPMFSEPGENQPPPEDGRMAPEMQTENTHPIDLSLSADGVADVVKDEAIIPVHFSRSKYNVNSSPTNDQLTEAFGKRKVGDAFVIQDGGGAGVIMLIIRGGRNTWWFEVLTKAV